MGKLARRRLVRDFRILQSDPPHGVSGSPINNDLLRWQAVIFGPDDTPWEGGTFRLELLFNEDYPNKPPRVKFLTRIFHPNVYMDGNICLDILQNQWSPIYDISAILTSIQSLLSDPNPNSPANSEAANLYAENRREYNRRIQQCVADSWKSIEIEDEPQVTPLKQTEVTPSAGDAASRTDGSSVTAEQPVASSAAESDEPSASSTMVINNYILDSSYSAEGSDAPVDPTAIFNSNVNDVTPTAETDF